MNDSTLSALDRLIFSQKRSEIHLLCNLLFEYMGSHNEKVELDRFVLVSALGEVFHPFFTAVFGDAVFSVCSHDVPGNVTQGILYPHHWLEVTERPRRIIDVLPVDGVFGCSVPQAVFHFGSYTRFIPRESIYPAHWGADEKKEHTKKVDRLVEIFQQIQTKVPL